MLWLASFLGQRLDVWLLRYPRALQARSAAFAVAQSVIDSDELRKKFLTILNGWAVSERSLLLVSDGISLEGHGLRLEENDAVVRALLDLEWATPERLERERSSRARRCLAQFLREHRLGAMVIRCSPTLMVIVGVGERASRRPFTFPEIVQLRELNSIFESALSRTQLLVKAQRAEQLATVGLLGAGVAHEIRNPLVSIKTFAQLLPKHFDDPKFRDRFSKLIVEEVARIDRLTEQLLDLAAPHNYKKAEVALHEVVQSSIELAAARSTKVDVEFITDLRAAPDTVLSDSNALKQVILNLCFNAIQAQEGNKPDRPVWVRVESRRVAGMIELAICDNGPGLPPDARSHLFEVFHSTKSTGFGLGLTVCGEILSSLDSTIALDPYDPPNGAVFRVKLPCPPHS